MKTEERTDFLDRDQLRLYFEQGCKPHSEWGIGSEYENFIFDTDLKRPVAYEGPKSISKVFDVLIKKFGWAPLFEKSKIVGLEKDKANISLEPGGQFELSGAIKKSIHEVDQEMKSFIQNMKVVCEELGLRLFSIGAAPNWERDDMPIMPKNRYKKIMMPYMKTVGTQGLDMMLRTCTIQVNLDYSSEADMAKKLRVAACIQPLATALFASSPMFEGKNTGYQSWRAQIWKNTDSDRTGIPKFIFDDDLSFDSWIEYALDVPMYFIKREGDYVNLSGESFRMFMQGQLKSLPNHRATYSDWIDHLTTIFTDVRLKNFIEMRGALDWQSVNELSVDVCKNGMNAKIKDKTLWEFGKEVLNIAQSGLQNRGSAYDIKDETLFLMPLLERVSKKQSLSSQLVNKFDSKWKNNFSTFYDDFNFYHGLRN